MIKGNKFFFAIILCSYALIKPCTTAAVPNVLRLPIAGLQGAAAAACLLTAATCLRSCLDTKLKPVHLRADSALFDTQPGLWAQIKFTIRAIIKDVSQTGCRTAELAALKMATLSATTVSGLCGLYLAFCSLRTLTQ